MQPKDPQDASATARCAHEGPQGTPRSSHGPPALDVDTQEAWQRAQRDLRNASSSLFSFKKKCLLLPILLPLVLLLLILLNLVLRPQEDQKGREEEEGNEEEATTVILPDGP